MVSDVAVVAFLVASAFMFFPYSRASEWNIARISETRQQFFAYAQTCGSCPRNEPRAFAWAARNDRNRAGRATGIECSRFARRLRLRTPRRHTRGIPARH